MKKGIHQICRTLSPLSSNSASLNPRRPSLFATAAETFSTSPPPHAKLTAAEVQNGLHQLKTAMDQQVIGQNDVKEAILLGLLAREHV
jgi:hypothetical protein